MVIAASSFGAGRILIGSGDRWRTYTAPDGIPRSVALVGTQLALITGTDEEGLQSAAGVFSRSRRSDISGNYASIGDGQVFSHIGNLKTPTPAAEFLPTPETRHSFLDDSKVKMVLLGAMLAVVVVLTVLLLRKRNNKNLGK